MKFDQRELEIHALAHLVSNPKAMDKMQTKGIAEHHFIHIEPGNKNSYTKIFFRFILDFLCIHPFNDGNGRISRLLTLLLLYKYDHKVGRYISLEKIIEDSKSSYYKTLNKSSIGWHEGKHNLFFWLEYFLGTLLAAYKEFEERVGMVKSKKGNKSYRVEQAVKNIIGTFSKDDIRNACPDVSDSTIDRVLRQLKKDNVIEVLGKGRNAKWKRLK